MNALKKACAVAMASLAALAFAGGGAEKKAEGRKTITFMAWYNTTQSEGQAVQSKIDEFNASQDKVKVDLMSSPGTATRPR
jgi:ABC-type glycerol-3-phosphate transport system substrate-binding protein